MVLFFKVVLMIVVGMGTPVIASHIIGLDWGVALCMLFPAAIATPTVALLGIWAENGEKERIQRLIGRRRD